MAQQRVDPEPPDALTGSSRRPLVMVLGMHRSGTSLCANVLAALGVDMAEAAGASPHNARGHWERHRINDWHDEVLALHRGRWHDPGHHLALPPLWWTSEAVGRICDGIADYLAPILATAELAGFKDPRTARLLAMWDAILDRLHAVPRFIFCIRDPSQVARSIEARDRTERAQAEYRWLVYNAHALAGIGRRPVCIVPYEHWFEAPVATARRVAAWIRPQREPDTAVLEPVVAGIVDAALRHDRPDTTPAPTSAASRLCRLVLQCAQAPALSAELLAYAENFLEFEQAATPLLRDAVILRSSVADQNRVIHDLQSVIRELRHRAA